MPVRLGGHRPVAAQPSCKEKRRQACLCQGPQGNQDHHHQGPDGSGHGTGERQGHLQVAQDPRDQWGE